MKRSDQHREHTKSVQHDIAFLILTLEELTQDTRLGYEFIPAFSDEKLGTLHLWCGKPPTKIMHCYVDVPVEFLDTAPTDISKTLPQLFEFIAMYKRGDNL